MIADQNGTMTTIFDRWICEDAIVTYCRVNATALPWRYSTPVEHPSSMASLQRPCTASRTAIESACPWQTPMSFLLGSGLSAETPKTQLEMYIVAGSTGPSRNCAFVQEQVHHNSKFYAIGSCKHNGYLLLSGRRDLRRAPIPPHA